MKILGITMGKSLQVFLRLHEELRAADPDIDVPALYVSDSHNFKKALESFPNLQGFTSLKEWDLTHLEDGVGPDLVRLAAYQDNWPGSLRYAVLADRRLSFGPLSKVRQDYHSRYSESELLTILDQALAAIDHFIDEVKPDVAISFGTATLGDYLFEVLLKKKGVRFWQLKATKIGNHVAMLDSGFDLPQVIVSQFDEKRSYSAEILDVAKQYAASVRERGVKYEGAILFSRERMQRRLLRAPRRLLGAWRRDLRVRRDPVLAADSHLPPALRSAWLTEVVHPIRTFKLGRRLPFIPLDNGEQIGDFAFYPMHFEPEVALQVFGRPFQNQIELIRNLALSLPLGTRLLVKEHPRSLGFRREAYYRKLLAIPNVSLIDPFVPTIDIVRRARLVCVVSGSVGLEAAILGKPLLVFGKTLYGLMPRDMVRQIGNLNDLDRQIIAFLKEYTFHPDAITRYLSALISQSVQIDLYTAMLNKQERYSEIEGATSVTAGYERLADFVLSKLVAGQSESPLETGDGRSLEK